MPRWLVVVGSGLGMAAVGAFLFWFVNSTSQVNGIGLLRRQDWPVNSPWVWAAVGFVVGAVGKVVERARRARQAGEARELATRLGRGYAESYSLPPEADPMPVFAGWSNGRNAMTGRGTGPPVTVFDYTTITRGGESSTATHGTAALLPADGLVAFDLRPWTRGRRILAWAGFEGLTFDPAAADPADADTVRRFGELFHLSATDPGALLQTLSGEGVPGAADREAAVRRLFSPAVMAVVNEYPAYAVQSHSGFLAVWRGSGVLPARRRPELWDAAVALRAVFTRPPDGRARPAVPGRAGGDTSRQARKLRNTALGGVAGLFVGFILAAMAMPLVFFRRAPGQGPGLGFFVMPALFFGLTLGGAAVGAGVGSRVPVRDLPPGPAEDPARLKSRQRATGCGVGAGVFGGFALFVGSKILFGWKFDDFGVTGALFFGSIFGGALLGAVLCGLAVNRLVRWRQSRKPVR